MLKKRDSSIWFMKSEIRNSALSEGYVSTWRYVQDYKDFLETKQEKKRLVHFKLNQPFLCVRVMNLLAHLL